MKILSAAQIREWDAATIKGQGITSLNLMERAAATCVDWIVSKYKVETPFVVVCGTGNNGGDGLAIAGILIGKGYSVLPFMVMYTHQLSPDCAANLQTLQELMRAPVRRLVDGEFITELPADVV